MKSACVLFPGLALNQDTHRLCLLGAACVLGCALQSGVLFKPHTRRLMTEISEKTQALFSAPIWCLTSLCNPNSKELDVICPLLASEEAVGM